MSRRGIVLAGGRGTRLHPMTLPVCKQLLPVYDKPMVYYSLSMLMLAGIREILIISTPADLPQFRTLLGDGAQLGVAFSYAVQDQPRGIAEAFLIGAEFLGDSPAALVLGDNLFFGDGLSLRLQAASRDAAAATIFAYPVPDPQRYGVLAFDQDRRPLAIVEKPAVAPSNLAVTGLYLYPPGIADVAATIRPSARGELEITDINNHYLAAGRLKVETLGRGVAWLDAGTEGALLDAANFVAAIERRQGLRVGCIEEIAWRQGWIDTARLKTLGQALAASAYGQYLCALADGEFR